ncbi:hypothetical protein LEMLEM_LOCUS3979, partial [Lemmus lemmus]
VSSFAKARFFLLSRGGGGGSFTPLLLPRLTPSLMAEPGFPGFRRGRGIRDSPRNQGASSARRNRMEE